MKRKRLALAIICVLLTLTAGCTEKKENGNRTTKNQKEQEQKEQTKDDTQTEITIWTDDYNSLDIRERLHWYAYGKKTSTQAEEYPDVTFRLVDKTHLTAGQYRQELEEALKKGEGPDIIFMDEYNGVHPLELMESGRLLDVGDISTLFGEPAGYAAGVREAGGKDGGTYIVPFYMECPVAFGYTDVLQEAGIQTDSMYGSLEEFLDAVLLAAERTGMDAFEDDEATDWLERYAMSSGQKALKKKLEKVRAMCPDRKKEESEGNRPDYYAAYRRLEAGKCLLGGCGLYHFEKLAANVSLMDTDREVSMISIPDSDGEFGGLITCAAGVSSATKHPQEAIQVLLQMRYGNVLRPDLDVRADKKMEYGLSGCNAYQTLPNSVMAEIGLFREFPRDRLKDYYRHSFEAVTRASYVQQYGDRERVVPSCAKEKTASICYWDHGEGEGYPFSEWLRQSAAEYEQNGGTCMQLLPDNSLPFFYRLFDEDGLSPDGIIMNDSWADYTKGTDFTELLKESEEELASFPQIVRNGIQFEGDTVGLPISAAEYGIWLNRKALKAAGISQDWVPADVLELTEGLRKLKKAAGGKPGAILSGVAEPLAAFVGGEELFVLQDDGSYKCRRDRWELFLSVLLLWKDENLVTPETSTMDSKPIPENGVLPKNAIKDLAAGRIGAVIGSSTYSGWFNGSYGLALPKKQKDNVFFVPLSPMVTTEMIFVTAKSERAKEIFDFWKALLLGDTYEEAMRKKNVIPLTQLSDCVRQFRPCQRSQYSGTDLWKAIWEEDATAAGLAEEYPWAAWAE